MSYFKQKINYFQRQKSINTTLSLNGTHHRSIFYRSYEPSKKARFEYVIKLSRFKKFPARED